MTSGCFSIIRCDGGCRKWAKHECLSFLLLLCVCFNKLLAWLLILLWWQTCWSLAHGLPLISLVLLTSLVWLFSAMPAHITGCNLDAMGVHFPSPWPGSVGVRWSARKCCQKHQLSLRVLLSMLLRAACAFSHFQNHQLSVWELIYLNNSVF